MADPTTSVTPDHTGVIDQRFFLAPLGGPQHPINYLDRFPETLYTKTIDTHLVRFLYSLLGPAGIGWLRKNYLEARLKLEDFGLENFDLDKFYGDPIGFGRILEEIYEEDPSGALTPEQWEKIRAKDARYRNRAIDYVNGAKAGNTPFGMRLVARSGLGHEVEIFERYRYLWDQLTDDQIGIPDIGVSGNQSEMVVIPRRELPQNEVQEITISGSPTGGTFQLVFPVGEDSVNTTEAIDCFLPPSVNKGRWVAATAYALNDVVTYSIPPDGPDLQYRRIVAGTTATLPNLDTTNWIRQAPGGDAWSIQGALEAIPSIGKNNVRVSGGPLPHQPILVQFIGYKDVAQLRSVNNLTPTGVPIISITTTTAGNDQTDEIVSIQPRDKYYMMRALDRIKPVSAWVSFDQGRGLTKRQIWNDSLASSAQHEVIRYVTGQPNVQWPSTDSSPNWIERGVEHKNPRGPADLVHHYQGYHNISSISAYTEAALDDVNYDTASASDMAFIHRNEHVGDYSSYQQALYPALVTGRAFQNFADMAPADYAEVLAIQNSTTASGQEVALINGIYPLNYSALAGVPQIQYLDDQFWSSVERIEGDDYLDIDLGSVKPVNYIYFEATQKPYNISVSYDLLDLAPSRSWKEAHYTSGLPTTTRLDYQAINTSPWKGVELWIENPLGGMIFTRFLRLKFARRNEPDSPFAESEYSIEVKNLRVARSAS